MKTISDPNFSIVVPGGCNAKCKFCFWKERKALSWAMYTKRLAKVLNRLPKQFRQISITGGEPTMSKHLDHVLRVIDPKRFPHVVLTTNGTYLDRWLNDKYFQRVVKHVNISRHHYDVANNKAVFGAPTIGKKDLVALCDNLNMIGKDVTLNAVITNALKPSDILPFINFAKMCSASAICFRKAHTKRSTLAPTAHERQFNKYKATDESSCPVCRSTRQVIKGMPVIWKASMFEPSNALGMVYEAIMHTNGQVTSDWEGKHKLMFTASTAKKKTIAKKTVIRRKRKLIPRTCGVDFTTNTCGSGGGTCGHGGGDGGGCGHGGGNRC